MEKDESQPKTQPAGDRPPPRPPRRTAIALGPDDDPEKNPQPKKETVGINRSPKPSAAPTVKLPTLPPGGPSASSPSGTVTLAPLTKRQPWWKFWKM